MADTSDGHVSDASVVVRELIHERQLREQQSPAEIEAVCAALIEGERRM